MFREDKNIKECTLFRMIRPKGRLSLGQRSLLGMTLAETMVVLSIVSIIIVISSEFLIRGHEFWQVSITKSDLQSTGQRAMDHMEMELKRATRTDGASPPDISLTAPYNSITFYLPTTTQIDTTNDHNDLIVDDFGNTVWDNANPIVYQYDSTQKQLLRIEGGNQRILANNVSGVNFNDTSSYLDELQINLNLQKVTTKNRTVSASFVSVVKLRN